MLCVQYCKVYLYDLYFDGQMTFRAPLKARLAFELLRDDGHHSRLNTALHPGAIYAPVPLRARRANALPQML